MDAPLTPGKGYPFAIALGAGHGGLDKGHPGDAVADAGVLEWLGHRLASPGSDRPFERPMQIGQCLVKAFRVTGRHANVRLDRGRDVTVLGPLSIELEWLTTHIMFEHVVIGDVPLERSG